MRNNGSTSRAQTVADMIEQMYSNISKKTKEEIAHTMYTQLSDGAVEEVANKLAED